MAGTAGRGALVLRTGSAMKSLFLTFDRVLTGLAQWLACGLLALISVLGLWQVLARFVFSEPSIWTEELMRRLLVWCVMLGIAVAFRRGALVSVDLMLRTARGRWRAALRGIITGTALAYLAVLLWQGIDLTTRVRFQSFASMDLSMAWAYAALPAGAFFCIVAVIANHLDPVSEELENAQ
ncbi:MAG: TRAP transporter small permease [Sphaerotilus natans subsp. sulfidivorans]|uniref:TRAP transporter small permease n=1 Tax=Sphaerotilus sulfidivorans TaxID=639200 RepID=UPI0023546EA4|nr:TRAP transporter small permease [Sphaerotilus sulfidivorans]MCK6403739.1 TRAP transporter small permease [Sphaerotilus sulfidivorans]